LENIVILLILRLASGRTYRYVAATLPARTELSHDSEGLFLMRIQSALFAMAFAIASPALAVDIVDVTFEAPGVQSASSVFNLVGIETFDSRGAGPLTFTNVFGNGLEVTYNNVSTLSAGSNGGAGGVGRYARVPGGQSMTIDIANSSGQGINYFGIAFSAFDPGNFIDFKRGGQTVFTFGPSDVLAALGGCPGGPYCGNPNQGAFFGDVSSEPFAFVNFVNRSGFFDQITLRQNSPINANAGYQSDNHTFANIDVIPEPSSWALLIAGFGLVGASMRRRQRLVAA
jgi:hypothetical protein